MAEPEIHYLSLPTTDFKGEISGSLQIPVLIRADKPAGKIGELPAGLDPEHMFWFSKAAERAAVESKFPEFSKLFGEPE